MEIVMETLTKGRLSISAIAVGMCERLLSECSVYAKKRKQFNESISSFQLIKEMLAVSATKTYAAKCMVRDAANKLSNIYY
jgi:acyl-CoA dehydrogenase